MRRRSIKLLLTLGSATLVAGLVFGSATGSGTQRAAEGSPDTPLIGAPVSAGAPSPDKTMGSATPVRIASLKALKSQPVKVGRLPETEDESGAPARPGTTRDPVVQRSAPKNRMPSPDQSFDGVSNLCGCFPPDTNGDVGPNHYMQW